MQVLKIRLHNENSLRLRLHNFKADFIDPEVEKTLRELEYNQAKKDKKEEEHNRG